jgi:hypothetical protein
MIACSPIRSMPSRQGTSRGAKRALDSEVVLNPGVLLDPQQARADAVDHDPTDKDPVSREPPELGNAVEQRWHRTCYLRSRVQASVVCKRLRGPGALAL